MERKRLQNLALRKVKREYLRDVYDDLLWV